MPIFLWPLQERHEVDAVLGWAVNTAPVGPIDRNGVRQYAVLVWHHRAGCVKFPHGKEEEETGKTVEYP